MQILIQIISNTKSVQETAVYTAISRMLTSQFAQNFLQLFFENHTQIQCFDVKITTKHLFL